MKTNKPSSFDPHFFASLHSDWNSFTEGHLIHLWLEFSIHWERKYEGPRVGCFQRSLFLEGWMLSKITIPLEWGNQSKERPELRLCLRELLSFHLLIWFSWNSWCICSLLYNSFPYVAYFITASKASSLVDYFILLPKIELSQVNDVAYFLAEVGNRD